MGKEKFLTVKRGKAFSCDTDKDGYTAMVGEDGQVFAWDSVAGYYTLCHSLTKGQISYIVRNAK